MALPINLGLKFKHVILIIALVFVILLLIICKNYIINFLETCALFLNNLKKLETGLEEILYFFFLLAVYVIKEVINVFMSEAESHDIINMNTNFIQYEYELFSNYLNIDKGNEQGSSKNPFPNSSRGNNSPINYGDYD